MVATSLFGAGLADGTNVSVGSGAVVVPSRGRVLTGSPMVHLLPGGAAMVPQHGFVKWIGASSLPRKLGPMAAWTRSCRPVNEQQSMWLVS